MSFLLDALGKADEDRRRAEVPELRTYRQTYRSPWRRVLSGLLIFALLMLSFVAGYMLRPYLENGISSQVVSAGGSKPTNVAPPMVEKAVEAAAIASPVAVPQSAILGNVQEIEIPGLVLEVISYSENPAARFAMINGLVLHEGDTLLTGENLVVIERDSVVLEKDGQTLRIEM